MLTVGSLFAGIGGFDLGFERAGFTIAWQVETDDYCRRVLAKNFPGTERFRDVKECCGALLRRKDGCCAECGRRYFLPWVDVICGGFPCQDISLNGYVTGTPREGLSGDRSGLYREMSRIIRVLRPRFVVLENVAALLVRDMGEILSDLAEIGYDAEWDVLPAFAFGAEHERERLFVVAYPAQSRFSVWSETGAVQKDARVFGKRLGFTIGVETAGLGRCGASRWSGDVHGIPARMDRISACGNAVVPQIAQWIAEKIKENLKE